ncbi:MAG: hypothetical protein ABI461_21475 [Polyangiaceae bacterium]
MSSVIFNDPIVVVTLENGYIRYTRSSVPYASLDEVRDVHMRIETAARPFASQKIGLLFDIRAAPSRNDDGFEAEILRILTKLTGLFKRHATLVRSMVGRLQVQRMARTRGDDGSPIFSDEREAIAFVSSARKSKP